MGSEWNAARQLPASAGRVPAAVPGWLRGFAPDRPIAARLEAGSCATARGRSTEVPVAAGPTRWTTCMLKHCKADAPFLCWKDICFLLILPLRIVFLQFNYLRTGSRFFQGLCLYKSYQALPLSDWGKMMTVKQ